MLMASVRRSTFWMVRSAAAAAAAAAAVALSAAAAVAAEVEGRGVEKLSSSRGREAR